MLRITTEGAKILDNKQQVPTPFRRPQHWIIQQFRLKREPCGLGGVVQSTLLF